MSVEARDEHPTTDSVDRVRRTLEGVIGVPATEGNPVEVLRNGDAIFPAMLEAIDDAQHTIDFLTFVYWNGEIGELFARAPGRARAGRRPGPGAARRLGRALDGPVRPRPAGSQRACRSTGSARCTACGPARSTTARHRKVLIADERSASPAASASPTEWQGDARNEREWRDTHFRIEGPAVDGLRAAFLDNWAETEPESVRRRASTASPSSLKPGHSVVQCVRGASETGWSDVATLFRTLLQLAERQIRITTAYFVPDPELTERLCSARDRGVEVDILAAGSARRQAVRAAGRRGRVRPALECGVRIWNFQPSMLHAKVMTVDGRIANIGSANLNSRSAAGRGDQRRRHRPCAGSHARRPLRRGPRAQHPHRTWALG